MSVVIAGFYGIGKTSIGKKYKNVIDLDSMEYSYDDHMEDIFFEQRKRMKHIKNKDWPNNYLIKIKECMKLYDIILVCDREDILEEFKKNNIDFMLCYPDEGDLVYYIERYKNKEIV